jgi:phosphoserine aminotransferase
VFFLCILYAFVVKNKMTTFYPGPSKIYPAVEGYLQDAFRTGVLSLNHRSPAFMDIMRQTMALLHKKLNIPTDYSIYFTSSATECWEIIAQSLAQTHSEHCYNGAFGQKWFEYSNKLLNDAQGNYFDLERSLSDQFEKAINPELLCLTHNETSNGTYISSDVLQKIRNATPALIAIDATSSLGGVALDWSLADVWFASVQKCLGLPAGMGIMICSPAALTHAASINDRRHYNSLLLMDDNFKKSQTHYTPNTLAIYLLMRVLDNIEPIKNIDLKIRQEAQNWYDFIENETDWNLLIQNPAVRSPTVIAISGSETRIQTIKQKCTEADIVLGNGYGLWQNNSFRIANFPAIESWEIEKLKSILREN